MTVQILHLSDPHFGGLADIRQIEAVERMIPDLRPDAVVISGDVAQRARHGEFQRARAFVNLARETSPVHIMPGNHDVQWWWRPFIPFDKRAIYTKYRGYFGDDLTPTLTIPGAVIASALTSHGMAAPQRTARRHLAAHGFVAVEASAAPHRGVGRRRGAVRPRPPGKRGHARRPRRGLDGGDDFDALARRPAVVL